MERDLTDGAADTVGRCREVVVVEAAEYPAVAALRIAWMLQDVAEGGGRVSLALAGGSTPRPVYEDLARTADLPWDRTEVFFGDERGVPPDHPDSNYRMARESLLDRIPVPDARVHRMEAERPDRKTAARDYARLLPERLDLVLLGIGADGHVASLFPGSAALHEVRRRVLAVDGPADPRARMTLAPRAIRDAGCVMVLARGSAKADAVARALTGPEDASACPGVLAREGTWILDPEAAAGLEGSRSGAGGGEG